MPSRYEPRLLAWLDLEATGSDLDDPLLEAALVVTDFGLVEMGAISIVIDPSPVDWMKRLERNEYVMNMHIKSGLVGDLLSGKGMSTPKAQAELIALLEDLGRPHDFMLAGRGVSFYDRPMIAAQMPTLEGWMARTVLDVGVVRRFIKRVCKREDILPDESDLTHRAMDDIRQHIAEALWYRDLMEQIEVPRA